MKQSQSKNEEVKTEKFEELQKPSARVISDNLPRENTEESIPLFRLMPPATPVVGRPIKLRDIFTISGTLKSEGSVVTVAGNVSETTLKSFQFLINEWYIGTTVRVHAAGVYTTDDASSNVAIKLKVGSTTYHTVTTSAGTTTSAPWCLDWTFIVTALGATGTAESYVSAKTNNTNKDSGGTAAITLDTTAQQLLAITATWASGDAADSISIRQFIIKIER